MRGSFRTCTSAVFGVSLALLQMVGPFSESAYGQASPAANATVSGTVVDRYGQPVAGVVVGYKSAAEIRADSARTFTRGLVLVDGRRQARQEPTQAVPGERVPRDVNDGPVTATPIVGPEDLQRLGLVTPDAMIAQLPSNVGTEALDRNADGDGARDSIRPNVIGFIDGKPADQTDRAGAFRLELPGSGTYVITAKIESSESRSYGSRQPVVVQAGQALQLSAPIILAVTTYPKCCVAQ